MDKLQKYTAVEEALATLEREREQAQLDVEAAARKDHSGTACTRLGTENTRDAPPRGAE